MDKKITTYEHTAFRTTGGYRLKPQGHSYKMNITFDATICNILCIISRNISLVCCIQRKIKINEYNNEMKLNVNNGMLMLQRSRHLQTGCEYN